MNVMSENYVPQIVPQYPKLPCTTVGAWRKSWSEREERGGVNN